MREGKSALPRIEYINMRKPKSPCMHGGKLCARHAVGCKTGCPEWEKFEEAVLAYRNITNNAKNIDSDVVNYQTKAIQRTKNKVKRK